MNHLKIFFFILELELRQKIDRIKLKVERLRRTLMEMKTDPLCK